jgi:hypothetical protein
MKLPRKRYLLPLLGLAGLLIFFVTGAILLPRILPLDSVKRDIESRVSDLAGGKITYTDAILKYAPRPQLIFRNSTIEIPGKISGTIDSLVVIPKLIPLLTGNIEIGRLSAAMPILRIELPPDTPETAPRSFSPRDSAGAFAAMISGISNSVKEKLVIRLEKGRIELVKGTQPVLAYRDIDGELRFSPHRIRMKITGGSGQDEKIAFGFDFDPARFSGKSHLELKRFLPQEVHQFLFPHTDLHFGESRMDLKLDLIAENPEKLSGTISGALPLLTLTRGEETQSFRDGSLTATFVIEKDRTELSVSGFHLAYPALNLTGSFLSDITTAEHRWEIAATDLNLSEAGKGALFLMGHAPLVQTLCAVLKEGWVRKIEVKDSAASRADLRKAGNLSIHGFLDKGTVYIPTPDLTLTEATGWVDVHNGILEGKDLRAQLGKAKGHGSYRMALSGEKTPFFLDTMAEAELSELPPLLHRLIDNKIFKHEMTGIADAKGAAEGRLIIDHTHQGTAVKVDVSRFNLTGRYSRIPYPVTVTDGEFHYDAGAVRVEKLRGSIGSSGFSGLNAHIGTSSPFQLDITSGPLGADMAQIHPWLTQYDTIAPHLKPYESVTGLISAKSIVLKGPALHPWNWRFSLQGDVKDLRVLTPAFPSPVTVRSGSFAADPETLVFDHATFETMDTTLQAQGRYAGYLKTGKQLETALTGALGAEAAAWVREKTGIPPGLAWQSPILLAPIRLRFNQQGELFVSGALRRPNGPAVELTLARTPERLTVEHLNFRDDDSDGTFSLRSENDITDLRFIGKLNEKTLNAFFTGTPFLSGHIEGDFSARFLRSKPFLSTAKGHLYLEQLDFSKFGWPLTIHQASLAGTGNGLKISSTRLTWQGNLFLLDGEMDRFEQGLNLDLTAAVEKIDWPRLSTLLDSKPGSSEEKTLPPWRQFPLNGKVMFHANDFVISEKLAFRPFEALVSFAGNQVNVSVSQAKLCGLSMTGTVSYSPDHYQLNANPTATDEDLAAGLACVWGNSKIIDGRFQIDGHLSGRGNKEIRLMDTLTGEMSFSATQGRIHRFGFFAKLFTFLNVAGLLKGEVPDLEREGFPYKTARATATLENGKLKITEGEIDSSAMRIFFSGEENLSAKTHDLTIVVAPLSTVDMLVRNIPLVRSILDKGVLIYPITATGTWENPQLNLLAPTAVGEQIWGIVLRTLKLPFNILKPVISGEKKKAPDPQFVPDEKPEESIREPVFRIQN